MSSQAVSVWNNCLIFIEDNIQPQAYKTWFLPIVPLKITENVLNIQVPSKFFYEWLEEHYVKLLKTALQKELGTEARLIYSIRMENRFGNNNPFTENIPSSNRSGLSPQQWTPLCIRKALNLKSFCHPGIKTFRLNPN